MKLAVAVTLLATLLAACTSEGGAHEPSVTPIGAPAPVSDPCTYNDYERVIRVFAQAVSDGDVAAAEDVVVARRFDGRFMEVEGNDLVAEEQLDARGFVTFIDERLDGEMRLERTSINSVSGGTRDRPEREFFVSVVDFGGAVRGEVECVGGEARLDQWLLTDFPLPDGWPCDRTGGACYAY